MAINRTKVVAAVVTGIAISMWVVYGANRERDGGVGNRSDGSSHTQMAAIEATAPQNETGRVRAEQSVPIAPDQKDGARDDDALSTPDGPSECNFRLPSATVAAVPDIPSDLPREFNYSGVSDNQLKDRAQAGDGYAQQVLAMRMQNQLIGQLGTIDFSDGAQRERWEAEFEVMRETFIAAIRNRSVSSASLLGETLLMPTPKRNPVEAAAWLRIEQTMGGDTLRKVENSGLLELTPDETKSSEGLAELLVQMYKLQDIRPDRIDAKTVLAKQFPDCQQ